MALPRKRPFSHSFSYLICFFLRLDGPDCLRARMPGRLLLSAWHDKERARQRREVHLDGGLRLRIGAKLREEILQERSNPSGPWQEQVTKLLALLLIFYRKALSVCACTWLIKPLCPSVGRSVCRWLLGARDLRRSALFLEKKPLDLKQLFFMHLANLVG